MAEHILGKDEIQVRFLLGAPTNGDYSVTVNTADCDSANMGSIPISYPRLTNNPISGIMLYKLRKEQAMKVVKLDRRHRLFRRGMTHAIKFENDWDNQRRVENVLRDMYGWEYGNKNWDTFRGKVKINRDRWGHLDGRVHPYWIGVRNEADLTMVLLRVNG